MNSGIYEVICVTSKLFYVGQTSHSLKQRYQEHIRYIQQNNLQSAYALHILNNKYEYGLAIILRPSSSKLTMAHY